MTLEQQILDAIKDHSMNRPRSLQTAVGPSDLAADCDHCLAAKFLGWPKTPDPAWLAYIGTAVHAQLAEAMAGQAWAMWETEYAVNVGTIGDDVVAGTADLWCYGERTVVDFKTAGTATMREVKQGRIPEHYRRQVHLYARGLGAERVALLFLPRNHPSLYSAVWWEEPYDAGLADSTMLRARAIHQQVTVGGMSPSSFNRADGCYDCARYPDAPGPVSGTLDDLFGGSSLNDLIKGK